MVFTTSVFWGTERAKRSWSVRKRVPSCHHDTTPMPERSTPISSASVPSKERKGSERPRKSLLELPEKRSATRTPL